MKNKDKKNKKDNKELDDNFFYVPDFVPPSPPNKSICGIKEDVDLITGYKEIALTRKMYFNKWEKENGDGFYPQLSVMAQHQGNSVFTHISFRWSSRFPDVWNQVSGSVIYGLYSDTGLDLIKSLNDEANVCADRISNWGGRIIYPPNLKNTTYKIMTAASATAAKK
jgi:hypothetical protein